MKYRAMLLVLAGCTAASMAMTQPKQEGTPGRGAPAETKPDRFRSVAAFSGFVGEWTIDAAWDDGTPLKARETCKMVLGDKHLKYSTFLPRADGTEYQRYEGYFSWHAKLGCLTCYSFDVDGGVSEYRVETTDGKTYRIGFSALHAGENPMVRQTIEFTSPDAYWWTVELRDGENWKRIMRSEWKRTKI